MSQRLPPFSADLLQRSLTSFPPASSWLVGFSGGADSTALLYALVELRDQLDTPFRAVYIDHGLHPDAQQWRQHCQTMCQQWDVPFTSRTIRIEGTGAGLEAEARERRYATISSLLQDNEALLTGHHAEDQAETLLLNLMRGSGVDGLSAMPAHRELGQHQLYRPLLGFHRQALVDYLNLQQIKWLEDPSNQSIDQDRNFIRHRALPLLESRFSGITKRLLLTQQAMAETRTLLAPLAHQALLDALMHPQVLKMTAEIVNNAAMFKLVIRRWIKQSGAPGIPNRQLDELYAQMQQVESHHQIRIHWADFNIRFFQNCLWMQQGLDPVACAELDWPESTDRLELGDDLGSLNLTASNRIDLPGKITIACRKTQPGLSLSRGDHHQSLKNLFQSAAVPVWLRDCVPLTLIDGELVAVGDWAIKQTFASWLGENHVKFSWQPNAPILQYLTAQQHNRQRHQ